MGKGELFPKLFEDIESNEYSDLLREFEDSL